MTPRQRKCLDAISEYWDANDCAPSYDDLMQAIGAKSKATVSTLVDALQARGYVEKLPRLARTVRVIRQPPTRTGAQPR